VAAFEQLDMGVPVGVLISGQYFGREAAQSFKSRVSGETINMPPKVILAVGTRLYGIKYRDEAEVDAAIGNTVKGDRLTLRVTPQGQWSETDGRRGPVTFRGVVPEGLDD